MGGYQMTSWNHVAITWHIFIHCQLLLFIVSKTKNKNKKRNQKIPPKNKKNKSGYVAVGIFKDVLQYLWFFFL